MHGAGGASGCCTHRKERADLEASLASVGVDARIVVVEQGILVIAAPTVEKVAVPWLVDLAAVRCCRPVRDATGADDRDALGEGIGGTSQVLRRRPRLAGVGPAVALGS